ncbi:ubiE/COQ5 methyltransferase [Xylariaceae sp. FL1272]|nr:ubiE/COQ5 methyltransferase [Xylariaceae sp. FL1272]
MPEQAIYTHGHHASVLRSHGRRTAANSSAYLLPHIKPTDRILDIGCGPGSITVDYAALVPQGSVLGIDTVASVLSSAKELAESRGLGNVTFQVHDANELPFGDGEFDVVVCHQVLQHVKEPVAVLREMRRVCKTGGIVAAREADYKSFSWYPELHGLDVWGRVYQEVARANGGEPNAGRYVAAWAREAGFEKEDVVFSWDCWNYQGEEAVVWARNWTERTLKSGFKDTGLERGICTKGDLEGISEAWREWGGREGAFIVIGNGEVLCRKR